MSDAATPSPAPVGPAPGRADRFQRRHPWAGFPLGVLYKFLDDQGGYLAALITYYGFLSLFPLLLLLVTILGFVLEGDPSLQHRVVASALSQFPIIGTQISQDVGSVRGSAPALGVGIVGTLYGGLGVAQAGQNAMNTVWAVPRHRRPNPITSRVRSLGLLAILGTGVIVTTVLSGAASSGTAFGLHLGAAGKTLALAGSVAANGALFTVAFRVLTARHVGIRVVLPGALVAAVGWQILQSVGTYYLGHTLKHAKETYGLFGIVLGLVGWIYLEALLVVLCAELNVVRERRLWPRSLLTPFTDQVSLTPADRATYTASAGAQASKGFEDIDVTFRQHPHPSDPPPDRPPRDC